MCSVAVVDCPTTAQATNYVEKGKNEIEYKRARDKTRVELCEIQQKRKATNSLRRVAPVYFSRKIEQLTSFSRCVLRESLFVL